MGISALALSGPISISYNSFNYVINQTVSIGEEGKRIAVDFVEGQVKNCLLYTSDAADE